MSYLFDGHVVCVCFRILAALPRVLELDPAELGRDLWSFCLDTEAGHDGVRAAQCVKQVLLHTAHDDCLFVHMYG